MEFSDICAIISTMGDFNKVFSFVLGLLVVVIILAIATKRFNLGNRARFLKGRTVTVSPTPFDTIEIAGGSGAGESSNEPTLPQEGYTGKTMSQTPKTGPAEMLLFLSFSSAAAGFYLRKKI